MRGTSHFAAPLAAASACLTFAGCSGSSGDPTDAAPVGPDAISCFDGSLPDGGHEAGAIEIGTGIDNYEPIEPEQTLRLHAGIQGGFHFELRPRIRGLNPGDSDNYHSPENPYTYFTAYDEDGDKIDIHSCGFQEAYRNEVGEFVDLGYSKQLILGSEGDIYDGQRVRIEAEILDSELRYARAEVWIVAELQSSSFGPNEVGATR